MFRAGAILKQGRATGALGEYFASPVAADGKIFVASQEGKIAVFKAGAQWDVLSVNDLNEEINATPALVAGRLYVRTRDRIYCFSPARVDFARGPELPDGTGVCSAA